MALNWSLGCGFETRAEGDELSDPSLSLLVTKPARLKRRGAIFTNRERRFISSTAFCAQPRVLFPSPEVGQEFNVPSLASWRSETSEARWSPFHLRSEISGPDSDHQPADKPEA